MPRGVSSKRRSSVRKNRSKKCKNCKTAFGKSTPSKCACNYVVGTQRAGKKGNKMYVVKKRGKSGKLYWSPVKGSKRSAAPKRTSRTTRKRKSTKRTRKGSKKQTEPLPNAAQRKRFIAATTAFKKSSGTYLLMDESILKKDFQAVNTLYNNLGRKTQRLLEAMAKVAAAEPTYEIAKVKVGDKELKLTNQYLKDIGKTDDNVSFDVAQSLVREMLANDKITYKVMKAFYNDPIKVLKANGGLFFEQGDGEAVKAKNKLGDSLQIRKVLLKRLEDKLKNVKPTDNTFIKRK